MLSDPLKREWETIFVHYNFTEEQLEKCIPYFRDDHWEYISKNIILSEGFLRKYY